MAGIGEDAGERSPSRGSDAGKDSFERMFVIGIGGRALAWR